MIKGDFSPLFWGIIRLDGWASAFIFVVQPKLPACYIPGTFWFGRFDVTEKVVHIEETNAGIALATPRLGDEDMDHFFPQKSGKIKRIG